MEPSWIVEPGSRVDLSSIDAGATTPGSGDKKEARKESKKLREKLSELQDRLWAEAKQSLLVVFQAMDGGGKDSTIRRVFGGLDPQGLHVRAFRAPTEVELRHDFLWRIHAALPPAGLIGVFNRSHYEDVVAVRVRKLVPKEIWQHRFPSIVDFENHLHHSGTTVLKFFLHISKAEQAKRLQERLERPDKRWKWNPQDVEDRKSWTDFQEAYQEAIERTSTEVAPWHIIPADHKWYRDWAVLTVLVRTLEKLDPQYPQQPMLEG